MNSMKICLIRNIGGHIKYVIQAENPEENLLLSGFKARPNGDYSNFAKGLQAIIVEPLTTWPESFD